MFCPHIPLDVKLEQLDITKVCTQQPFMSSLLKSSQFSSVFHSSQSHDDLKLVESPPQSPTESSLADKPLPESASSGTLSYIGNRLLSGIRLKTKSWMDLPSLWSSSLPLSDPTDLKKEASSESITISRQDSNRSLNVSSSQAPSQFPELSSRYLSLPQVKKAIKAFEESLADDNIEIGDTFLVQILRNAFSSCESLNHSFLYESLSIGKEKLSGIDLISLREAFGLIFDVSSTHGAVLDSIINSLEIILAKLQLNIRRLQAGEPKYLRQLLVLIEVFFF